jgi:hypothetical protein
MYYNFIGYNFGFVALMLLTFGVLQWFHSPVGSFPSRTFNPHCAT